MKKRIFAVALTVALLLTAVSVLEIFAVSANDLYNQLLATESLADLQNLLNNEENSGKLLTFTQQQIDAVEAHAAALNETDPNAEIYANISDTLTALRSRLGYVDCTCGTETEEHASDCPLFKTPEVEDYSSGLTKGSNIFYANATNAALFEPYGGTTVSYNATNDVIRFNAPSSYSNDPGAYFNLDGSLSADTYKYIVISFRTNSSAGTQLYLRCNGESVSDQRAKVFGFSGDTAKFQTAIVDLTSYSWWKGSIQGFRYDYLGTSNPGDWMEVDAIGFFKTEDEAKYFCWERDTIRNHNGSYLADEEMVELFQNGHNCVATYDAATESITLTVQDTGCTSSHGTTWEPQCYEPNAYFDPMISFKLPEGISNKYRYMVMTYMSPNNPQDVFWDISDKYPNSFQTYEQFGYAPVGIYPATASGSYSPTYSSGYRVYEKNVYYVSYIDLKDDEQGDKITQVRIDPFNLHYVKAGAQLKISAIIFTDSIEKADNIIAGQLQEKYPYNYELSFDANTPTGGTVTGIQATESVTLSQDSTHTFHLPANPSCTNYKFMGWSETPTGAIIAGDSYTVVGTENQTVSKTLYAIWEENKATINYQIVGEITGAILSGKTESVLVVTGTAAGTTVTAQTGFKIVGWYTDENCTSPAESSFATNTGNGTYTTNSVFVPTKTGDAVWTDTTYYCKIAYAVANLTITTSGLDSERSYIFTISGTPSDTAISFTPMTIVINGNNSKMIKALPVGEYTVTEQSGWSWRVDTSCNSEDGKVVLDGSEEQSITFTPNGAIGNQWLDDETYFGGDGG